MSGSMESCLGCLRRALEMGDNWPVDGIENSWEEYWHTIFGEERKSGGRERDLR